MQAFFARRELRATKFAMRADTVEFEVFNYESLIYLFGVADRSCERHKEVNKMIMSYGSILLGLRTPGELFRRRT